MKHWFKFVVFRGPGSLQKSPNDDTLVSILKPRNAGLDGLDIYCMNVARPDTQGCLRGGPFLHHYHERTKRTPGGGRGSKVDVRFFQILKMTILFQKNHHFIAFLFVRFFLRGGGGWEFIKRVRFVRF